MVGFLRWIYPGTYCLLQFDDEICFVIWDFFQEFVDELILLQWHSLILYLGMAEKDVKSYLTGALVTSKLSECKHTTEVEMKLRVLICANLMSFGGVLVQ